MAMTKGAQLMARILKNPVHMDVDYFHMNSKTRVEFDVARKWAIKAVYDNCDN